MGISGLGSRDHSGNRKRVVRRRRGALLALLASFAVLLGYAIPAQAVHDTGAFQLDGDAMSNTNPTSQPAATDDWDKVCHEANPVACPAGSNTSGATAVSWTDDGRLNASIFTGGGSKDGLDVDQWAWKDGAGGLPNKDNLLHAFAARYSLAPSSSCQAGGNPTCDLLFFGSDRFANDGDAQQGFWFFQNKVTLGTGSVGGGTSFNGIHKKGDILILSNFSNGGTISTINVYAWDPTAPGSLKRIFNSGGVNTKCGETMPFDGACAIANSADGTVAPWPFKDTVQSTAFRANEFLEGGLNLSLLELGNKCFASVLAETRSSTSTNAVLKDFVLGTFANCEAKVETTPSVGAGAIVVPGTSVTDGVTVTGRGVPLPPTPTGTVNFFLCGPIATGTCDSGRANAGEITAGTATISGSGAVATGTSSIMAPTAEGRYCFRAEYSGDVNYPKPAEFHVGDGDSECFYVAKPQSNTVTTPVDGNGTPITEEVLPGTTVHDRAVVTGTAAGGDPTGNVNFYVCGPIPTGTCDSGGVAVNGNPRALVSDGNPATYTSSTTSGGVAPTVPGRYCFRAEYEGSAIYQPSGDNTVTECFVVEKIPTITVTTPVDGSGTPTSSITLGQSIQDRAVVSGSLIVGDPTGTVDFYVCGPRPFDDTGTCDSGGTALPENPRALVSDGDPATSTASVTSGAFTPTSPGRYCFRAVYSGSTVYITSEDGSVTECFIVKDTTSTTTAQDWLPNDSATVLLSGNGPASGTVTFVLKSGTCAAPGATLFSQSDVALDSSGQAKTSNTTIKVTTSASVIWETTFTPSDPTTVVGSTHCESTSLTIVN